MSDTRHQAPVRPTTGDVVVTKVANRYHIGQVHADQNIVTPIAMRTRLDDALMLACRFATQRQRVFLFKRAASLHCVEIDCAKLTD